MSAVLEGQGLSASPYIELFSLTLEGAETLRFTNAAALSFAGQEYVALPVELAGVSFDGGAPARPTLTLGALSPAVRALILGHGNLLGAALMCQRIFAADLADPAQVFAATTFRLDRLIALTAATAQWELVSALDFEGTRLPRRTIARDFCPYTVRTVNADGSYDYTGVTCPYTAAAAFNAAGESVSAASEEVFSRRLTTCCTPRFGNANLPFGGFPGAERG